jgi:DNA-binding transcriptional MerR regulator
MAARELLRMREVCARTGLARSTIHHYIREGLLPKPRKSGRNTALYDEDFVRRVQLVKTLQEKMHLPLARIRETLDGMPDAAVDGIDPDKFTGVTSTIAARLRLASEREVSRTDLLAMAGVDAAELDGMARAGLVEPIKRGNATVYDPVDVRIVLALGKIREAGATAARGFAGSPQIVEAYRKHLTALARTEAREMLRMMRSLADMDVDAFVSAIEEPLSDLIAAMHRKALARAITDVMEG